MKRTWQHPEVKTERRYWRSLGEYNQTPEFSEKLGREFDPTIAQEKEEESENSRRDFLKIAGGAAMAGLALSSCRRPLQKILPFTKHVEWLVPGKPLLYATSMPRPWGATPMVVVTHEGRPTHLQGNTLHPQGGGLDIFAQASVLELYNPFRVTKVTKKGDVSSWADFGKELGLMTESWKSSGGAGLGLLVNTSTSPARAALIGELQKTYPQAKVYCYEPLQSAGRMAAEKAVLGEGVKVLPKLAKADCVFSFDCDFIGLDSPYECSTKEFMKRRAPAKKGDLMNRVYVLENRYTLTGGIADHRKPIPAALIPIAAAVLAEEIGKLTGNATLQAASAIAAGADAKLREWLVPAAADLVEHKGKALVLAGPRYDESVHALVLAINAALGSFGATLEALTVPADKLASLADLKTDLQGKKLKQLVVMVETDPAFDAGLEVALKDGGASLVQLALRPNKTTTLAEWVLPAAHYLEAWGDARTVDGSYAIVQPMIQPLFGGVSQLELVLALLGKKKLAPAEVKEAAKPVDPAAPVVPAPVEPDPAYEAVKASFAVVAGGWNEEKWDVTLRDGFLPKSAYPKTTPSVNAGAASGLVAKAPKPVIPSKDSMEVVLTPDASIWDGRHIDNAWLQEAPDPITKLTWDNAVWMSPRKFAELGLKKDGDLIKLTIGDKSLELPVIACPGHAFDSVTIPLGYGQDSQSEVGKIGRGFDVYPLVGNSYILSGAKIEKAAGSYALALTQEIYTMEARAQVREGTLARFEKDQDFADTEGMDSHIPKNISLYKGQIGKKTAENPNGFDYENNHQWGMVIDLSKCIGCSDCIVACQSENNIAVVGKDQVIKGRIMQWIRMDRYFATSDDVTSDPSLDELDNPEMIHQPVACQQCESAPCETVCPVNATVHTEDGLNAMAYNRCIGTRYCANNCPFTARRFNYFDYNKRNPLSTSKVPLLGDVPTLYAGPLGEKKPQEVAQLQKNPNVTVRMRGVIEKCTYCVQRLEAAKINQRRVARDDAKKLRVPADSIKVACQASCSADAIMFGDLANEKSAVNEWKANPRNYMVLKYLGIQPRTSYLARIRNVNPKMPDDRIVKTGEASINNI
jgi:MoCo/4Fe-4S cofactor protein with predicted Tat translocation signal